MGLNKKLVGAFASASALTLVGVAIQQTTAPIVEVQAAVNNSYINAQKFANPPINYTKSTFTEGVAYAKGRPEGIIVHETGNSASTLQNEVTYMQREWNKTSFAYVHAFVDRNEVRNIHTTNQTVWGAGPNANGHFIQIELVHEHSNYNFAHSISNDAYYIATLLKQYGLKPSKAKRDGTGTIWSHRNISYYLHGTDHGDPDGYFASFGYSMDQFYDLIVQKYNSLGGTVQPPDESGLMGTTSNSGDAIAKVLNNSGAPVYSDPGSGKTNKTLPKNSRWKVFGRATVNGQTWYRVATNQWIEGKYSYVTGYSKILMNYLDAGKVTNSGSPIARVEHGTEIPVYKAPGSSSTGQKLRPQSGWKVFGRATYKGQSWYKVGSNDWIEGKYLYVKGYSSIPVVNIDSGSVTGTTSNSGTPVAKVEHSSKIPVYTAPGSSATGQKLPPQSNWKVFGRTIHNGQMWYKVGSNDWIEGKYLYVTGYSQIPVVNPFIGTTTDSGSPIARVENGSDIPVYKAPDLVPLAKNCHHSQTGKSLVGQHITVKCGTRLAQMTGLKVNIFM
ncbi:peptidoglycan recognition protein family protein [Amylolactobacillus amylophilus]|uniref:peptidoglycan recognition protein family protein n=2 Tax=Amylolactobacillus amylophilus TaxID=1603 RepID=UPI0006D011B7|nr:SLAP domain-containing protein [Amylolactobacillus amylophilus]